MRLVVGETVREGHAIDGSALDVSGEAVAEAIRRNGDGNREARRDDQNEPRRRSVRVACEPPGAVHERVGLISRDRSVNLRGALAAAARSRGRTAPQRAALDRARERLDDLEVPTVDLAEARRAVAEAGADEARLREKVASLRGRVQALEGIERGAEKLVEARTELTETAAELSSAETERIAAEQRLDRAERVARDARDARERRFRLQDRVANLERRARAALARDLYPEFASAVRAAPAVERADGGRECERVDGGPEAERSDGRSEAERTDGGPEGKRAHGGSEVERIDLGDRPADYAGGSVTASLAIARIAAVQAPIVLTDRRFSDAETASAWLSAPVIRL